MRATRVTQDRSTDRLSGLAGDVVEHQFVRALIAIASRKFQDVADDSMIAEAHALDDLSVANVEAGDYAFGKNGCNSSTGMSSSSKALPLIAAAAPAAASACRSCGVANSAGGLPLDMRIAPRRLAIKRDVRAVQGAIAAHVGAQHVLEGRSR